MTMFSDEELLAYADEHLDEQTASLIETELRINDDLSDRLQLLLRGRDQGELSVGEVWKHGRLSCPERSELSLYLIQAVEPKRQEYLRFHLETVGCVYCRAELEELKESARGLDEGDSSAQRRERLFASSAGLLKRDSQ